MAKDLVLDVIAKKNSRELSQLADEFDRLAHQTDDFGKKMHEGGTFSQFLDEELAKTRVRVKELGDEFDRTGSKDVFANLRGAQSNLKSLERIRDDLSKALEDGAKTGGEEGARSVSSSLDGAVATPGLGPILTGVLVAAAVMASPGIGAALASAASLGGIAGIVVGQFGDPKVHAAITGIATDFEQTLSASTKEFQQPIIDAANQIDRALVQATQGVDWKAAAAGLAPFVDGISRLVQNMLPGFNDLLKASSPIMHSLDQDLASLGKDFGTVLHLLASGSKGEAEMLRALIMTLGGLAIMAASVVYSMSKLVEWFNSATNSVGTFMANLKTGIPGLDYVLRAVNNLGSALEHTAHIFDGSHDTVRAGAQAIGEAAEKSLLASENLEALSKAADNTAASMSDIAAKWSEKLFSEMMNLDQATLGWHKSLVDLNDTLKQNGLAIDRHTHLISEDSKKGIENREAILAAVQANMAQYQAMVASGISAADAAQSYDQNTEALKRQLQHAHYTSAQIEDLIGKYERVPDKVNTALAVQGLTDALNNLGNLLAEINHINGQQFGFTVVGTVYDVSGRTANREGRAQGGPVTAGTAYTIGEEGPELFVPSSNGYIVPNRMLNARSGYSTPMGLGTAAAGTTVNLTVNAGLGTNGYDLGRQVAEVLRPYVRGRGGSVQVALGT